MIYLDNAATTLTKPRCVIDAVVKAMNTSGNSGRSSHGAAMEASRTVFAARKVLADFFGADGPEQVAFTANATQALNTAIKGLISPGDHVITTALEHNSVLRPLYEMEEAGAEITVIQPDSTGMIDCNLLEQAIRPETKAIVCTHASNVTGNIIDAERVGKIARKYGVILILDASQTAGFLPIDMRQMGIDVLCFTGHKGLRGPQGTGGIIVRKGLDVRPLLSGGSGIHSFDRHHPAEMPTRLEAGTLNVHGIAGLAEAVRCIGETGLAAIRSKELSLAQRFYDGVKNIRNVILYGNYTNWDRSPIVSLNIEGCDSASVSDILSEEYCIAVRPGIHCAPLVHKAFGTEQQGMVRFSMGFDNTKAEIDSAVQAVFEIAERFRED